MKTIPTELKKKYMQVVSEFKNRYPLGITNIEAKDICTELKTSTALLFHLRRMGYVYTNDGDRFLFSNKSLEINDLIKGIRQYVKDINKEKKATIYPDNQDELQRCIEFIKSKGFKVMKPIEPRYEEV